MVVRRGRDVTAGISNPADLALPPHRQPHPGLYARSLRSASDLLAVQESVCLHDDSNASSEEVHMKIHSIRRIPMQCATVAAGNRALLG